MRRFSRDSPCWTALSLNFLYRILPKSAEKRTKFGWFIKVLRKWDYLSQFSRNSRLCDIFLWAFPISNFLKIRRKLTSMIQRHKRADPDSHIRRFFVRIKVCLTWTIRRMDTVVKENLLVIYTFVCVCVKETQNEYFLRCRDLLYPVRLPWLLREGRTQFFAAGEVPGDHQPHLQKCVTPGTGRHYFSG